MRWLLLAALISSPGVHGVLDRAPRSTERSVSRIGTLGRTTRIAHRVHVAPGERLHIEGRVLLVDGGELSAGAGAHLVMAPGASIHVDRTAFIRLVGTVAEPVVLACRNADGPGCWSGVTVDGWAPINHGTLTSPAARFATASGCREAGAGGVVYGGCDPADSSGILRYVQIRDAQDGLILRGVGRRTTIERVQAHHSLGSGVSIVGGTVDVRYLALTVNGQFGLTWRGGWIGRGQYVVIQQDPAYAAGGILGANGVDAGPDDALPRSAPTLSNVLVTVPLTAGNPYSSAPPRAVILARGTAGTLRNVLVVSSRVGIDVDDAATCSQAVSGALTLRHAVIASVQDVGDPDADPPECTALGASPASEAGWVGQTTNQVTVLSAAQAATLLRDGADLLLPDFRARPISVPLLTGAAVLPPSDGFFDQRAPEVNGVETSEVTVIPWYSGWTVGGALPPSPTVIVNGVVSSPVVGPLPNVLVTVAPSGFSIRTDELGRYAIIGVPGGSATLSVTDLPLGCASLSPRELVLRPGGDVTEDFTTACVPAPELALAGGGRHVCGLDVTGHAWCWGDGASGQLGGGTLNGSLAPMAVIGGLTFQAIAASNDATCAIDGARAMWCWGDNRTGQLGIGVADPVRNVPSVVAGTVRFKAVSVGSEHACAISDIDDAYCWGANIGGKLGLGTSGDTVLAPSLVAGGRKWRAVSAGGAHTCGITTAGVAFCWGTNTTGALGASGVTQSSVPVAVSVPAGQSFIRLEAGESSTCAVASTGVGYCWGTNIVGQLGTGSTASSGVPIPVAGGVQWSRIAMTAEPSFLTHTCGVGTSGTGYCWGLGQDGQLGLASPDICSFLIAWGCARSPQLVPVLPPVLQMATSRASTCALTRGSGVWCWGRNDLGQLGDGTTNNRTTPAAVSGSVVWPSP
jgi:alpha-tubulin suppressor-like RCC1 family protein